MTSQKPKKFVSIMLVLTLILTLLPATLGLAASYSSIEQFVENVYEAGLGRKPDEAGYNYWVKELKNGRPAAEFIGYVLLDSPEFAEKYAKISNEDFAKKAYEIVFNRAADAEGLKFWVSEMNKGGSHRYVIVAMLYAPEFAEFCEAAGIKLGTLTVPANEYPGTEPANLEVVSVSANNLKEVVIEFNKAVEKATAEDVNNYSINGKVIASAVLSDDGKSVTLTLDTTGANTPFTNQTEYKLTFNNIRSGSQVVSVNNYKFTPIDATLPTAVSVEALGNKTVKVTFNEPIKTATTANFLIDGKTVIGYTELTGRTVIVKLYSPLSNGSHTINVKNAEDYSGLKSLSQDISFVVVEDKSAPYIVSIEKATFEKLTLKFSEPIDPSSVIGTNVYWLQGTTKKYAAAEVTQIADDTFEFDFTSDPIQYTTDVYVTNVKDYSGNVIAADTKIQVTPVVDTTRPEIITAELDSNRYVFTIKFTKALNPNTANKADNYVVKDADGKEVSKLKTATLQSDGKTVKVQLAQQLSEGKKYTLEVSGVSDNTLLNNVMLPYTKTFDIADKTGPSSSSITVNRAANNTVVVTYPEVMAVDGDGSVVDTSKYLYSKDSESTWSSLPSGVRMNITSDGKSVLITFPADVDVNTITNLRIQLVKDLAGNYITGLTVDKALGNATAPVIDNGANNGKPVVATATNKIVVHFDKNILANTVNYSDFTVTAANGATLSIVSASASGKKVTLTLADANKLSEDAKYNGYAVQVSIRANATTSTAEGMPIAAATNVSVNDQISATVKQVTGSVDGTSINVEFNETLAQVTTTGTAEATDFIVKDKDGNVLVPGTDYNVTVASGSPIVVISLATAKTGIMSVEVSNPRFLKDASGNLVDSSSVIQVDVDDTAPTAAITSSSANSIVLTFSEALYSSSSAIANGADIKGKFTYTGTGGSIDSAIYDSSAKTVTFTISGAANGHTIKANTGALTDADGNAYVPETITYNASTTAWTK